MNVIAIASRPRTSTGPPFERLYAVEPDGVEQIIPSHETTPSSSPAIAQPSSIIRPSVELVATTSLTAANALAVEPRLERRLLDRPVLAREDAREIVARARSGAIEARKPTRPKLTPITGTPLPRSRASVRRIVPSPPTATVELARARGSSTSSTPPRSRHRPHRSTAVVDVDAAVRDDRGRLNRRERCVDSLVEVIGKRRVLGMDEVEEDLPVSLRARAVPSLRRRARSPPQPSAASATSRTTRRRTSSSRTTPPLAHVGAPRLELRLHEHDRLPARRAERAAPAAARCGPR